MMVALNAAHPDDVFEYAVSGAEITIWQRDGGEIEISEFTATGAGDDALTLTITGSAGQGDTVVAREIDVLTGQTSATSVEAAGSLASRTEATISLSSDDAYGFVISNGVSDFTLSPQVVDLSETASVQTFTRKLEAALDGSGIAASMDLNGKIYLTRADGGEINLKSFSSVGAGVGTWTPKVGQGDQASLDGTGSLSTTVTASAPIDAISVGGGGTAIAQLSVATQAGAAAAIAVVDNALSYVNSERSKLGAVENRLVHTIDNLSNVITNTEASRSRIVDTDYAAETSELARSQIIQQAATAMLAQANQSSQAVLSLLQ
jgi:flagellin